MFDNCTVTLFFVVTNNIVCDFQTICKENNGINLRVNIKPYIGLIPFSSTYHSQCSASPETFLNSLNLMN